MSKVSKMNIIIGLFFVLLIILVLNPRTLINLYSTMIGRCVLIFVVLFFSMNNITLGLLAALIVIIASNMLLFEGMEGMDNMTTTSATTSATATTLEQKKANLKSKIDAKKADDATSPAVDLETIKNTIQAKSSNSLPATTPTTTEEPTASSQEAFRSMYASV
jgi:hypothetical protein